MAGPVVRVRILGDASSLQRASNTASNAIGRLEGLGSGLGGTLAAAFSGAAILKFAKDSVKAASDIEEATNKIDVILGAAGQKVADFARTTSTQFGLSRRAALEQTATFANLFSQLDSGSGEIANMSMAMTKLAADLASFNNTSVADAMSALQSGLTGRSLPLRRYGILLDAATLKERAFSMGLRDTTVGVLPPLIRMQAAYAEIMAQSSIQQGDFARTSASTANSLKTVSAQFDDLRVSTGEALTPFAKGLIQGIQGFLPVAQGGIKAVLDLAKSLGFLGGPMDKVVGLLAGAAGEMLLFGKALSMAQSAMTLMSSVANPLALGLMAVAAAATVALSIQAHKNAEAKKTTDELAEALRAAQDPTQGFIDRVDKLNVALASNKNVTKDTKDEVVDFNAKWAMSTALREDTLDLFNRTGVSMESLASVVQAGGRAFRVAAEESTSSMHDQSEQIDVLRQMLEGADPAQQAMIGRLYEMAQSGRISQQDLSLMLGTLAHLGEAYDRQLSKGAEKSKVLAQEAVANKLLTQEFVDQTLATYKNVDANRMWVDTGKALEAELKKQGWEVGETVERSKDYILAHGTAAQQVKILRGEIEELNDAYKAEQDAILGAADATLGYESASLRTEKANRDVTQAQKELSEALEKYPADSDEVLDAQEKLNEAINGAKDANKRAADALMKMLEAQNESGEAASTNAERTRAYVAKLRELAEKASDPTVRAFLQGIAADLEENGKKAGTAAQKMQEYLDKLSAVEQRVYLGSLAELGIPFSAKDLNLKPMDNTRALGGPVSGGMPYVVGERGPELFVPQRNGSIIPNGEFGAGGGVTIVVNTPIGRPDDVIRYIREELRRLDRGQR